MGSPLLRKCRSPDGPADDDSSTTAASHANSFILREGFRDNRFHTRCRAKHVAVLKMRRDHVEGDDAKVELQELNRCLDILAQLFPDVKAEVFREMLIRFDGSSRLEVCVQQLIVHKEKWVDGRWLVPPREVGHPSRSSQNDDNIVPIEERFRSESYKEASRAALRKELHDLSKSVIEAVLAENNYSYTRSRPILLKLENRSWRATFGRMLPWKRRRTITNDINGHYMIVWSNNRQGEVVPMVRDTQDVELKQEMEENLLQPLITRRRRDQEQRDRVLAQSLNEEEAVESRAMYECGCCFSEIPFELLSTCTSHAHAICFNCIHQTVKEALYGQGWCKSVDVERGTLKCLCAASSELCSGFIPSYLVQRAVASSASGPELWLKFEERLASESLLKSELQLVRCPFCPYAEVDPFSQSPYAVAWRLRRHRPVVTLPLVILTIYLFPLLAAIVVLYPLLTIIYNLVFPAAYSSRQTTLFPSLTCSLSNALVHRRPPVFRCRSPRCSRKTCRFCQKLWHDPHVCNDALLTSLRTTVEAARTSALKRTCPRCNLSFVKSSGCNKLTCVCGYSMCYLCRKALDGYDDADAVDNGAADGGGVYAHFCGHFRANGGPCTKCTKCELYRDEDEEEVVRRAGEKAEREWREKEGLVGVKGLGGNSSVEARGIFSGSNRRVISKWLSLVFGEDESAGPPGLQGMLDGIVRWSVEPVVR